MITYTSLAKRPQIFQRLTGVTLQEFDELLDKFSSSWDKFIRETRRRPDRQRAPGGGRTPVLRDLTDKLVFVLVYVRMYPLLFLHGLMFGIAESNSCLWVHRLLSLLDEALGYAHKRPLRGQGRRLDELITEFPELKELGILGDGTERPIRRPKDNGKQKTHYTGKKKRHTLKNIVITRPGTNTVLYLGQTQPGSIHDKTAIEAEQLKCRSPMLMGTDLAFQGLEIPNLHLVMPTKKPAGKELTQLQKGQNKLFSSIRVNIEHAICGVKRSHAAADTYRNIRAGTDDLLMSIACGLHNLRVAYRYTSG